jgi:hypothetical protein
VQRFLAILPAKWHGVFRARFLERLDQRAAAQRLDMRRTTLAYQEIQITGGNNTDGPSPVDSSTVNELTTDRWTAMSSQNAPSNRDNATAVWTGKEMIIWGGLGNSVPLATGGRYDPATDQWLTVATLRSPLARYGHSAVWTGKEMIVWAGYDSNGLATDSGGRYDPATDTWSPLSRTGAPAPRTDHAAVWSGTHMLIWGGRTNGNLPAPGGYRYDPVTDSWSPMNADQAPASADGTRALWTGSELLLFGGTRGFGNEFVAGVGLYNPAADRWRPVPSLDAPIGRIAHVMVWSGREAIIWGGSVSFGSGSSPSLDARRLDPAANTWRQISTIDQPAIRAFGGLAVFATGAGSRGTGLMLVVGGSFQGGAYDPASDQWWPMSMQGTPSFDGAVTVWTGRQLLMWGNARSGEVSSWVGARYEP